MQPRQRAHIETVLQVATGAPGRGAPDGDVIRESWRRCVAQHRLDPQRMQQAVILSASRLREHQQRMEDFLGIARHGMRRLYQQVAGLGYVVLLTDARGITVDFMGDLALQPGLKKAGLYLGADWSEPQAGTCGVGTCINTGQALTVHRGDHFDATHIPLSCTTAPVYDDQGELTAVLDISSMNAPESKESQHLALQMVKLHAQQIENAGFMGRFRRQWVLRLGAAPQFLDMNPDYLIALDAAGRIAGHNRRAQLALEAQAAGPILGQPFEAVFGARFEDLGRYLQGRPAAERRIALAASEQLLFMEATPPPARPGAPPRPNRLEPAQPAVPSPLAALCGGDAGLSAQIRRAARLVDAPVSFLVTGETGCGKEFFAQALHASSRRAGGPFVAVNCAAIPESLVESELFGYLPHSFSGAGPRGKKGLVQAAHGGTLFLDEIGDMPPNLQARLLRVLSERQVLPVGATQPVAVDVRVVAATHCDLRVRMAQGLFRGDLFYRLQGAAVHLPAVRQRTDLPWLIARVLRLAWQEMGGGEAPPPVLSAAARQALLAHAWPGNLRELRNALAVACGVCSGQAIELEDLPESIAARAPLAELAVDGGGIDGGTGGAPEGWLGVLRASGWNLSQAARTLGVARMTLYRRLKKAGIESPNRRDAGGACER